MVQRCGGVTLEVKRDCVFFSSLINDDNVAAELTLSFQLNGGCDELRGASRARSGEDERRVGVCRAGKGYTAASGYILIIVTPTPIKTFRGLWS